MPAMMNLRGFYEVCEMAVRICDFILGILIGIPAGVMLLIGVSVWYSAKTSNRKPPTKDEWRQE